MHPLTVQKKNFNNIFKHNDLCDGDVIIMDDSIDMIHYNFGFKKITKKISLVFLNSVRNSEINFFRVHSSYYLLRRSIRIIDFRAKMMKIVNAKLKAPVRKHKIMLSDRELQIINASLHGYSVRDIARAMRLKEKTVYHYRKSACVKLGASRFLDLVPFTSSFLIAAYLQSAC